MSEDSEGFDEFFRAEFVSLIAFVRKFGYGLEESKDAAAEAMFCALRQWAHVKSPRAWVRTAAYRIVLRRVTKQRGIVEQVVSPGMLDRALASDPSDEVVGQLGVDAFLACLPPTQREVMNWHLDGFKTSEIAEALGMSEGTARSNLRHARACLKRLLETGEEERGYGS